MLLGRMKIWLGSPAGFGLGPVGSGPGVWVFPAPTDVVDAGTAMALSTQDIIDEGTAGMLASADVLDGGTFIQET
ncbi:MAG: hypothetical protein AAGB05_00010 [Pseudomonadota bacterium]